MDVAGCPVTRRLSLDPRAVDIGRQNQAVNKLSQLFPGRRRSGQTAEAAIVSSSPPMLSMLCLLFFSLSILPSITFPLHDLRLRSPGHRTL